MNRFGVLVLFILCLTPLTLWMLLDCWYANVKYYLICLKLFKNVIKICYSKRQCASASGDFVPPDPVACAVLKFPLKSPALPLLEDDDCLMMK